MEPQSNVTDVTDITVDYNGQLQDDDTTIHGQQDQEQDQQEQNLDQEQDQEEDDEAEDKR